MEQARNVESFLRDPSGQWFATRTTLVWNASPTLSGIASWGRPSASEAEENLRLFESLYALRAPTDLVMDGSGIEAFDLDALECLLAWARQHMDVLQSRVRRRIGVIPDGTIGLVLAGLSPVLGWLSDVSIAPDLRTAVRELNADEPDALTSEIEGLVRSLQGVPALILELRVLLRSRDGNLALPDAARLLGTSTRTLQRALSSSGTSFRVEEQDARFEAATRLLSSTDDKVSAIARKLGVTEGALTQLLRTRTGTSPAAYREKARSEALRR
jgi:AraC-like DNA-binding protein